MNAKVIVYLLISAFVLSGCSSFTEKNKVAIQEFYDSNARVIEDSKKASREFDDFIQKIEKDQKEREKYIAFMWQETAEYKAWYDSLPTERQAFITRELEEKQIRYNQIYGFNKDGSSRYLNNPGRVLNDRLDLMNKYKSIWNNEH